MTRLQLKPRPATPSTGCPCGACVTCSCDARARVTEDGLCLSCGGVPVWVAKACGSGQAVHVGSDVEGNERERIGALIDGWTDTNLCLPVLRVGDTFPTGPIVDADLVRALAAGPGLRDLYITDGFDEPGVIPTLRGTVRELFVGGAQQDRLFALCDVRLDIMDELKRWLRSERATPWLCPAIQLDARNPQTGARLVGGVIAFREPECSMCDDTRTLGCKDCDGEGCAACDGDGDRPCPNCNRDARLPGIFDTAPPR